MNQLGVKERILSIRLLDKVKANPAVAEKLKIVVGIKIKHTE